MTKKMLILSGFIKCGTGETKGEELCKGMKETGLKRCWSEAHTGK